jgi:membrane fusion protein, multidrug efflux system
MGKVERKQDFAGAREIAPEPEAARRRPETLSAAAETRKALKQERLEEAPKAKPKAPAAPEPGAEGVADASASPRPGKARGIRRLLFLLLPVALAVGGYLYVTGGQEVSTDNAYIRADTVSVSTDVAGTVQSVAVTDNQRVTKGEVLYRLDPQPFEFALTKAQGQLGIVKDQLLAIKANYDDLQTQIKQQQMDIAYYQRDFDRKQDLAKRNFASQADYDLSLHNLNDAQQKLASLQAQLAGDAAKLDGRPDLPVEKLSGYAYAQAQVDEAARQLRHTTVRAPFAGIVTNVPSLQVGQQLAAGTPAFSLVATDHVWVEANPKETQLTYVRPGQKVSVSVDTYPDVTWQGTVDSISPASASSFSLLPAQNASGNWVKVVQRIPLKVKLDTPPGKPPLRAGMSVEIEIDTGHARGLPTLLKPLFGGKTPAAATGASHG